MFVEMVTAPGTPALDTMRASRASWRAFRTRHLTPRARSARNSDSDSATLAVPTRTGRPVPWARAISSTRADVFASRLVKTTSGSSTRRQERLGGNTTVVRPYSAWNSSAAGTAVAVMPATRGQSRTRC